LPRLQGHVTPPFICFFIEGGAHEKRIAFWGKRLPPVLLLQWAALPFLCPPMVLEPRRPEPVTLRPENVTDGHMMVDDDRATYNS